MNKKKYNLDDSLAALRSAAVDGTMLTASAWDAKRGKWPSSTWYIRETQKTWVQLADDFNLKPAARCRKTDAELIARIKQLENDGFMPSKRCWDRHRGDEFPTAYTVAQRLGPWSEIGPSIGLKANTRWNQSQDGEREAAILRRLATEMDTPKKVYRPDPKRTVPMVNSAFLTETHVPMGGR